MGFTVTCHSCGHQFPEIEDSMSGQQARCRACGEVVTLASSVMEIEEPDVPSLPADEVQVNPTVMPGRRVSGALPASSRPRREIKQSDPESGTTKARPKQAQPPLHARKKKAPSRPSQPPKSHTEPPVELHTHPLETTHAIEVDKVDHSQPLVGDTFADLDQILAGGADAKPLTPASGRQHPTVRAANVAPKRQVTPALPKTKPPDPAKAADTPTSDPESAQSSKPVGPLVGTVGAMAACAAGLTTSTILVVARFSSLENSPVKALGQPLFGLFHGVFESGVVEGFNRTLMVGAGWVLTVVGALLLAASIVYLIRLFVYLLGDLHWFGWIRGISASLGVLTLFVVMALWFSYNSHYGSLERKLGELDPQKFGMLEEPENVKLLRESYELENRQVITSLSMIGAMAFVVFAGGMVALWLDESRPAAASSQPATSHPRQAIRSGSG